MKLLSIDVGIKNLAFCLLRVPDTTDTTDTTDITQPNLKSKSKSSQFEILLWDVVGISQSDQQEADSLQRSESHPLCYHHAKTQCKSKAAYFYYSQSDGESETIFTCKRHAQASSSSSSSSSSSAADTKQVISMTLPQISKLLKTGSNDRLFEFCESVHNHNHNHNHNPGEGDTKPKRLAKPELIERAKHVLSTRCLFPYDHSHANLVSDTTELLTTGSISKKLRTTTPNPEGGSAADTVSLISVGYNLMQKFDKLFYSENSNGQCCYIPDRVVIENQISPIATRMKTVQGMVTQYFLMRGVSKAMISYISATNKLKAWSAINADAEIDTYDDRKKTGIACVRTMLGLGQVTGGMMSDADIHRWRTAFESHKKKDDMADSLLQGLSCL